MATVFDIALNVARRVRPIYTGKASAAGTTTTLIDTVNRAEEDDRFNGQTLFVVSGDNANTIRRISDFEKSSGTITVDTAWDNASAENDQYVLAELIKTDVFQAINAGLTEIGEVTKVDESLSVVANQTEYTLPSGVYDVVRVEVSEDSEAPYDYDRLFNWQEVNGKLYFKGEINYTAGRTLRVFYNAKHDAIDDAADIINTGIPISLITACAAYYYSLITFSNEKNSSPKEDTILQMMQTAMYEAKQRQRVRRIPRDPIYFTE